LFVKSDIVVTDEARSDETRHAQFQPTLLAEVTSYSTRKTDMVDKLIQYQKFPSLKYYLIVEQDKEEVIVVSRNAEGNLQSETFNQPDTNINLTTLEGQLSLKEIYAQ
jgi:Uma2 family endonuclease